MVEVTPGKVWAKVLENFQINFILRAVALGKTHP